MTAKRVTLLLWAVLAVAGIGSFVSEVQAQVVPNNSCRDCVGIDGGSIGGCTIGGGTITCANGVFGAIDAGTELVTRRVTTPLIDAGVVGVNAPTGNECAIGILAADNFRAQCFNRAAGLSASGPYIGFNAGTGVLTVSNSSGNITVTPGSGNTINLNESITAGSKIAGTITLVAGTGTATVKSSAVCVCSDTTAANAVRCSVATTTLTAVGTGTDVIAYHCF